MNVTILKKDGEVVAICLPNADEQYPCEIADQEGLTRETVEVEYINCNDSQKVIELFSKLGAKISNDNSGAHSEHAQKP